MVSKQLAKRWAEHPRQREEEERRRQRVMVITEFDAGDLEATLHALADEVLKYRRAVGLLAKAIGWAGASAPFAIVPPGRCASAAERFDPGRGMASVGSRTLSGQQGRAFPRCFGLGDRSSDDALTVCFWVTFEPPSRVRSPLPNEVAPPTPPDTTASFAQRRKLLAI
jgi:hypothetical protein